MKWKIAVTEVPRYYDSCCRAIQRVGTQEVVAVVDLLDNSFVKQIVKAHDEDVSRAYEQGLRDGLKMKTEGL